MLKTAFSMVDRGILEGTKGRVRTEAKREERKKGGSYVTNNEER